MILNIENTLILVLVKNAFVSNPAVMSCIGTEFCWILTPSEL